MAWVLPVLLLRFVRSTHAAIAATGAVAAMLVQNLAYIFLTAIPFNRMTVALGLMVSVVYAIPMILDRIVGIRLPASSRIFLLPSAMVVAEFGIGSALPLGTSIGMRAITQGADLPLLQLISITGPYSIAFMIGLSATVANRLLEASSRETFMHSGLPLTIALSVIIGVGQARLAFSTPSATPSVKVAAITPDLNARRGVGELLSGTSLPASREAVARVSSSQARAAYGRILDSLIMDTRRAARAGAKIVVWSETAAPSIDADKPALLAHVARAALEEGIYLVAAVGVPFERNEIFLYGPDGRQLWHYRKNHPVPGMEPVAPSTDAIPVVATPFGRLAGLICFDGDFPSLARVDADIMLAPSWDWPEVTYAHTMRMVRLRAIENGYALLRPVFFGVTGAFDSHGRTLAMQETMSPGAHILLVDLPVLKTRTIYNRLGDTFAWSCALGLAILISLALRRRQAPSIRQAP